MALRCRTAAGVRASPSSAARIAVPGRVAVRPAGVRRIAQPCRAVQMGELEALLMSAMERSACEVADRVGIIGLKLESAPDVCWEASVQLSCYVRDYMYKRMQGAAVLELGSGIGLGGLTAACFGANVVLTDLGPILPLTAANVRDNQKIWAANGGSARVEELDWAQPDGGLLRGPWDLILGSDLVNDVHDAELLAPLLANLLAASPSSAVLMAHMHRSAELDDQMTEVFASAGLRIKEASRSNEDVPGEDTSIIIVSRA